MYARKAGGGESTFGVSGRLWRDALVMYDRETRSLWSQIDGRAIDGPLIGETLEEIPSTMTTWGDWKNRHPDTLVLRPTSRSTGESRYDSYFANAEQMGIFGTENPDGRLPGKSVVLGVEVGDVVSAIPLGLVEERGPVNGTVGEEPVVVVSVGTKDATAFRRRLNGVVLEFDAHSNGRMTDRQTGSVWETRGGRALSGALEGQKLTQVAGRRTYWFVWATFYPETELLRPNEAASRSETSPASAPGS